MEKRLINYKTYISNLNIDDKSKEEQEKILKEVLVQISFFQHERFIHLIVTVTFAILTMLCLIASMLAEGKLSYILLFLFLIVLLIPYIRHYYILENGVQYIYTQYDRLRGSDFSWSKKD